MASAVLWRVLHRPFLQRIVICPSPRCCLHSAIPTQTTPSTRADINGTGAGQINLETIQLLERLSLVDFANVAGVERLEAAINFASVIKTVDTDGVEPLYSVLEGHRLHLREDEAVEPRNRSTLMDITVKSEEDYYVSPQGNVPLDCTQEYDRN